MRRLLLLLPLLFAGAASAQAGFMPYAGYNVEDEDFLVGVGARFALPLQVPVRLVLQPTVEYQFVQEDDTVSDLVDRERIQLDVPVIVEFAGSPSIAPYAGAGLGVTFADSDVTDSSSELGLTALGGLVFNPSGFGRPFVQGRYATRGEYPDALSIQAGVILGL